MKISAIASDKIYDKLSKLLLVIFAFTFIILSISYPCSQTGESDDYVIATLSIQNHGSLNITSEDVESLKSDFPALYDYVKNHYDNKTGYPIGLDGNQYPWYVATYSIAAIPFKWFLQAIGGQIQRAYMLSNVVYYLVALLIVFYGMKTSRKNVFITLLMLICSASLVYFFWTSAEMFICALIIISLVFFVNDNHHLAGLSAGIASTLNMTICGWGLFILADYFVKVWHSEKKNNSKNKIRKILVKHGERTGLLAICFLPFLFTITFNFITFGRFTPQAGMSTSKGLFGRFLAYFFDLNLGFLPYYPIALLLFFALLIYGAVKKERKVITMTLGLVLTVFLVSFMGHINCGQTLIARYNSWLAPFLVFVATTQTDSLFEGKLSKITKYINVASLLSAFVTALIVTGCMRFNMGSYVHFSAIAQYILDNAPALYNPLPSIFASRTLHIDGAYSEAEAVPIIYSNDSGLVKKILVPAGKYGQLENLLLGNREAMEYIRTKDVDKNGYSYINIPRKYELLLSPPSTFDALNKVGLQETIGVYGFERYSSWFQPEASIKLRDTKIAEKGLEFSFSTVPKFTPFVQGDRFTTVISINEIPVSVLELGVSRSYTIKIQPSELPPPDELGLYDVTISTNGKYNPYEFGDSGDNRDLALSVEYLGAARDDDVLMGISVFSSYFSLLQKDYSSQYSVLISVKDEATAGLNDEARATLKNFGLQTDFTNIYRRSFIAVWQDGKVVYEQSSEGIANPETDALNYSGVLPCGLNYTIKSAGYLCGDISSINIDGKEFSKNNRGFNIVVYDNQNKRVVDSVSWDTFLPGMPSAR